MTSGGQEENCKNIEKWTLEGRHIYIYLVEINSCITEL